MATPRFALTVRETFAAAHQLVHHEGACQRLHGHTWTVELTVAPSVEVLGHMPKLPKGILIDFAEVKKVLRVVTNRLDHRCLNDVLKGAQLGRGSDVMEIGCPIEHAPTAEVLCLWIAKQIRNGLPASIYVKAVTVYESPDAWCRVNFDAS